MPSLPPSSLAGPAGPGSTASLDTGTGSALSPQTRLDPFPRFVSLPPGRDVKAGRASLQDAARLVTYPGKRAGTHGGGQEKRGLCGALVSGFPFCLSWYSTFLLWFLSLEVVT